MSHREGRHEQHIHHSGSRGRFFADWKEMPILSMLRLYRLLHRPRLNYMSTHLISPHKVFSKPLPSPPPWPKQIAVLSDTKQATSPQWRSCLAISRHGSENPKSSCFSAQWKECNDDKRRLDWMVNRLATTLRSVHKRKINWPKNESFPNEWAYSTTWPSSSHQSFSLSLEQYMKAVLIPILHLYHQLHSDTTLQKSLTLELRDINVDGGEL